MKQESWQKFATVTGNQNPWSIVYKIQTKKLKIENVLETIKCKQNQTSNWEGTIRTMLQEMIPDDTDENESPWQIEVKTDTKNPPNTADTPPFHITEIRDAIKNMSSRKAPGHDLIEVEMIKQAWPVIQQHIQKTFNECLKQGVFPRQWKKAEIKILLKSADKPAAEIKSYRPISLLPVLGKLLEKLIAGRLAFTSHHHPLASRRQYGFKPGHSTEDAIVKLRDTIEQTTEKYAIGLMFDISGAFDGVWWPSVLHNLKKRDCPRNIYNLIASYLSEREAQITSNTARICKAVSKGCPQGSVLGPQMWNLILDEVIEEISQTGTETIAYADDIAIIVTGNSRIELERKANTATAILKTWCEKQKLEISAKKSQMVLLKGLLDIRRPPTVPIGNTSLKMVANTRYLGIHYGTRFNITAHVNYVSNKSREILNNLAKVAKTTWGLNTKSIKTIYTGVFVPITTYAAAGWADRINAQHRKKLRQAQRAALLRITRAYRTISTAALCVIAGEIPIDLKIKERSSLYHLRKGRKFTHHTTHYEAPTQPIETEIERMKRIIRSETVRKWQQEWDAGQLGRLTHQFYGNVEERLNADWIHNSHYMVQILSGHGNFKSKLKQLGQTDTESCRCGQTDTVNHVIFECESLKDIRKKLEDECKTQNIQWPCPHKDLVSKEIFNAFHKYATEAMAAREEAE